MNKNQNVRRVLSLLFAMVMLVSMMVVGTVVASAAEVTDESTAVAVLVNGKGETKYYDTLGTAVAAATTGNNTVTMLEDCGGDFTLTQKAGVNITINGNTNTYTGTMTVNGGSRTGATETLEFKNVTFTTTNSYNFSLAAYAHNITFDKCTFNGSATYAINMSGSKNPAYNLEFKNDCIVDNPGSYGFFQAGTNATVDIEVNGMTVYNCNYLFKVDKGSSNAAIPVLKLNDLTVESANYVVVAKNLGNVQVVFSECDISAKNVVYVWKQNESTTVNVECNGNNTLVSSVEGQDWLVLSAAGAPTNTTYVNVAAAIGGTYYANLDEAIADLELGDVLEDPANVGIDYDYVNEQLAANGKNFEISEDGTVVPSGVAEVNGTLYETLADAVNAVKNVTGTHTITLLADCDGTFLITQKEGVNLIFEGNNKKFTGKIYINGNGRSNGSEYITFNNVKFYTENTTHNFVDASASITMEGYKNFKLNNSHNITFNTCTFDGPAVGNSVQGMVVRGGNHIHFNGCNANNVMYLVQSSSSGTDLQVIGGTINATYGIRIHNGNNALLKGVTLNTVYYGVIIDTYAGARNITLDSVSLNGGTPIFTTSNSNLNYLNITLKGNNTINGDFTFGAKLKLDNNATLATTGNVTVESAVTGMIAVNDGTKYFLVNNATIGAQLVLGSTINVNFVVDFEKMSDSSIYVNGVEIDGFLFTGIVAKQMADVYTVTVVYNGYTVGEATFSVKSIAEKTIAETDGYDDLLVALLNYGAEAQKSFDYNENNLANAGLNGATVENVDLANGTNNYTDPDNSYYGASVSLKNEIKFNFKFFADRVPGAAKAVITIGQGEGAPEIATVTTFGTDRKNNRDLIVVTVNVSAVNADDVLFCTFYDAEGNAITAAGDSVLSYCVRAWAGLTALKEADATNGTDNYAKQACGLEFYQALANYAVIASGYAKNN